MLSIYKPATTWLEGVPYLVPASVLNLTTVSVLHPKGNCETITVLTTVLRNAVCGRCV